MSKVKQLKAHELEKLREIGKAFTTEVGYPTFNFDSFAKLWRAILSQGLGSIYYVEADGVEGILGASFTFDPFSGDFVASEQFWFVRHDKRQSRIGLDLLAKFEKDAEVKGCKRIVMVHLANSKEEVLPKVYARRGYVPAEHHYWKKL